MRISTLHKCLSIVYLLFVMLVGRKWLAWVLDFLMKNDVDNLFNEYFFVICMPAETCLFRSLTIFILLFVCTLYMNICAMVAGLAQKRKSYC